MQKVGSQDQFALMEINTAITKKRHEEAKQERKEKKEVTKEVKFQKNFV